jgi:NAD(P)-dependent dehydrogenase (short-subunit alcohol dehydrogenase family)
VSGQEIAERHRGALVVTGAGGGIGTAICRGAAARGIPVVLVGRDADRLEAAARTLPAGAAWLAVAADVRDEAGMVDMAGQAAARFGGIGGLVCCHAAHGAEVPFDQAPLEDFEETFSVNVVGILSAVRAVGRSMRAAGRGNVVLFSSGAGHPVPRPEVRSLAYQLSKFGVEGLVNGLAVQLRGSGINVNGFRPGRTASGPNLVRGLKGLRSPEQAVDPVLFLATLAPGELSGFVLESSDYERGFRPIRGDHTLA